MCDTQERKALRRALEAEARRLGFDLFGVSAPDPPPHLAVFESWLEHGRHGQMGYLAAQRSRERRADPRRILPECRSVVILGVRYPVECHPCSTAQPEPIRGRIAAYAWNLDYHDVLSDRLKLLVGFIENAIGRPVANRWYTDTGPVLERDLAQRAGLGWIGKNTCLINPDLGSYLLLAELLLEIELDPDAPFMADRCGSCTRCLEACPTGCILPDRTLDARRCISYLTIELKDAIPIPLRTNVGDWVFGCDVCQQICPWNTHRQRRAEPKYHPPPDSAWPDLIAELGLDTEAFNRKYKGSPLKRARRRGYLRNVAVALGNSGDPGAVPALAQALLNDSEPLVRGHAAWALGNLGGELAFNGLKAAQQIETDAGVRSEIDLALNAMQAASL